MRARARSLRVEVGVEVDLGGVDLLVAEPERDDGGVDAGVQQPHGGGVAQRVRRDVSCRAAMGSARRRWRCAWRAGARRRRG